MEASFLRMDIFFIVTTVVVVFVGILLSVLMYYLIKVVRDISEITATVKVEAQGVIDDVREVREDVKEGIANAKSYGKAIAGASLVRGVSKLMESFMEEKAAARTYKRRSTRSTKND